MLEACRTRLKRNFHERRMDRSGVSGVRGDREDDRMVARARPAIRSRICQPSLACRTTFLINDGVAIIQRAFSERLFYRLNVIHLIEVGADDYLTKPFDVDVLLARLRARSPDTRLCRTSRRRRRLAPKLRGRNAAHTV